MKNKFLYLLILPGLFLTNIGQAQITHKNNPSQKDKFNPKDEINSILSFSLKNKKQVILLESPDHQLTYLLLRADSTEEFRYAALQSEENKEFVLGKKAQMETLTFQNGTYVIYESTDKVGIKIYTPKKTYDWQGDKSSQEGSLRKLENAGLKNVLRTYYIALPQSPYYGQVFVDDVKGDKDYLSGSGWVKVFDKKNHRELVKVESPDLFVSLHEGNVKANIQKLPYGEQSVLIYEDFNFDGKKDLAISDGNHSCYGGPSYQIYLANADGFSLSEIFTDLAQNYCGMFAVNKEDQTLSTMTKSGCCWHQFSTFRVKDHKPYPIKIIEEDATGMGITIDYTVSQREKGQMVKKYFQKLSPYVLQKKNWNQGDTIFLNFIFKNKKKMYFLHWEGKYYYVLMKPNGIVEFLYDKKMEINRKEGYLFFNNKDVTYKIYKNRIEVIKAEKVYTLTPVSYQGKIPDKLIYE